MLSAGQLAAFGSTALLILLVPGPTVLFVVGRSLSYGRRTGLVSALGNDVGTLVLATAVALGLGSFAARSAAVLTTVKLVGAAYLVLLGVRAFRNRHEEAEPSAGRPVAGLGRAGLDGFLVGVANPKSLVFLGAVLPQFVDPARGSVPLQMFTLGALFSLIALTTDSLWSLAAGSARAWFARSPRRRRLLAGTGGLTMIGLGLSVAFLGRAD